MVVGRILTDPIPMTPTTATALLPLLDDVLDGAFGDFRARLIEEGYGSIRPGHGCVFGHIDGGGSRLTDLASDSGFTKQAVGEAVADLESLGFVERAPDPDDGRAKDHPPDRRGRGGAGDRRPALRRDRTCLGGELRRRARGPAARAHRGDPRRSA